MRLCIFPLQHNNTEMWRVKSKEIESEVKTKRAKVVIANSFKIFQCEV